MYNSNINLKKGWLKSALLWTTGTVMLITVSLAIFRITSNKIEKNHHENYEAYPIGTFEYTEEEIAKLDSLLDVYGELMLKYDKYGSLNRNNNPYGITDIEYGMLDAYRSREEAKEVAMYILRNKITRYNVRTQPIEYIFKDMYGSECSFTEVPTGSIKWKE